MSHATDGAFPPPSIGSPLAAQPRAIGALIALDEGLNLIIARPALYGLLPCAVLGLRSVVLLLLLLAAGAYGFDWWTWQTMGRSLFELPEGAWSAFALVIAGLLAAEHASIHFLLACLPRSLRQQRGSLRDVFTADKLLSTLLVRLVTYLALGVGFAMLGVGSALALPLVLAPFYAADQGLGVGSAIARSSKVVLGHFGTVLLFEFVSLGLLVCGFLLCGVGLLPAYVLVTAGRAALYDQLSRAMPTQR